MHEPQHRGVDNIISTPIWSDNSKRPVFFELEISISELRTHLKLFSAISGMKLRFFRRNGPEVNVALVNNYNWLE